MEDKKSKKSVFATLYAVNVNDKTEKKNGLTYLSWAFAWGEVKKAYPDAIYRVYENANGWNYFTDGKTCWVKTSVTIEGIENIEYLPVMDYRNNSIDAKDVKSTDVNKAIQRSLTKCCARHGLGLYIYAGEDIPESDKEQPQPQPQPQQPAQQKPQQPAQQKPQQKASTVTEDMVKNELEGITSESRLVNYWGELPEELHAKVLPLFKAKRQTLKGGKA